MHAEDMILVSVDDHLVEPPDLFDGRLPARSDRAPKVIRTKNGDDVWTYNDAIIPNIGLNAVAGRPKEEYGIEPTSYEEMRRGCFDIAERVKDMNAGGVLGSMCFPSFPSFSGRVFGASEDKDLGLAVLQAYNDWHIDEWCASAPGRFIPMAITPLVGCRPVRGRGPPGRGEGVPLDHVHREPGHARLPELPQPSGTRCGRRCVRTFENVCRW